MRFTNVLALLLFLVSCHEAAKLENKESTATTTEITSPSLVVLGTVQDAGSPHIACKKNCCKDLFQNPESRRKVVSLAFVDPENEKKYLFEASPDMPSQLKLLKKLSQSDSETADGIFLSHAHIGHYTGLMYLGKEAMAAKKMPVYAMPKMKSFLEQNGPWSQLVKQENISIIPLKNEREIQVSSNLKVQPFTVPHRDEYSETVGFKIIGPNKTALFIPDIDKWEKWNSDISDEIAKVDYAFLDATFYDGNEINNRDISLIPHPFVIESMEKFDKLSNKEKQKIHFIHLNHTNPLLNRNSEQYKNVVKKGFNIAETGMIFNF